MSENLRYGEQILKEFDPETDLEIWQNKHERDYLIKITLPEFCCLCPRSGYPDFATIYVEYVPNKLVVELKAIKLYINSFMGRNISHEDSINEIYSLLERKLEPKYLKIVGDFNPRGNVHTVIEICSDSVIKKQNEPQLRSENRANGARRIEEREKDRKRDEKRGGLRDFKGDKKRDEKPKRGLKEGFRKPAFADDKKPRVVKKDR
ncbi:NADH-ubiquinone oxidoreductase subunit 6 [Campylobacter mucosalis]|uniref:preQ(1) synthase n=1 Tax=Campylobacter mucosalis TaxID=202 RepID=UPI0004D80696|nr:preQ(1) synthase [Campylobacter mucosalis]KEA45370.1 NADH-ubiquinone oxidoreductase subunit 6 [Campylobacter mucosalis]QKF62184.1 7-cyano-7-deazaguanine reductase [Campylobacter mucosalis]